MSLIDDEQTKLLELRPTTSGRDDLPAFVVPLIVLVTGYAALRLHERDLDRRRRDDPAG